jgi:hypothetical protein
MSDDIQQDQPQVADQPQPSEQAPAQDQTVATGGNPNTSQAQAATNVAQSLSSDANSQRPSFDSQEPSVWKRVLQGALGGLVHGGVLGAASGGVNAASETPEQYSQNKRDQSQVQENRIRFDSAQAASLIADAHMKDQQLQAMPEDIKNRHLAAELANDDALRARGYEPTAISDNTQDGSAEQSLIQMTQDHGAVPPVFVGHLGDQHVAYNLAQDTPADMKLINDRAEVTGQPEWTTDTFSKLPPNMKQKLKYESMQGFGTEASTDAKSAQGLALKYENLANTYAAKSNADPDTLAQLKGAASRYRKDEASWNTDANSQLQKQTDITSQGKIDVKGAGAPPSTDWVPKVSADEKKKAELAENIAENSNQAATIMLKRPELFGPGAGRYTSVDQMIGNNDPDISKMGVTIHNIAMANSGVHGFRSQEGVEATERLILNNFKNGPQAVGNALKGLTTSTQTFIDNARPESYRTHSKQGGALKGMVR